MEVKSSRSTQSPVPDELQAQEMVEGKLFLVVFEI